MTLKNIPKPNEKREAPKATPEQRSDRPTTLESAKQWIADRTSAMLGRQGTEQLAQQEKSLRMGTSEAAKYRAESGVDAKLAANTQKVELLSQSKRGLLQAAGYGLVVGTAGVIGGIALGTGIESLVGSDAIREKIQSYKGMKATKPAIKNESYDLVHRGKDEEESRYDHHEVIREVTEDVKYLRDKLGIEVNVKGVEATMLKVRGHGELRNPDAETWARMVHSFRRSADAYPPSMFHRITEMSPSKVIKLDLSLRTPASEMGGVTSIDRYNAPSIHVNIPERVQDMNKMKGVLLSDNKGLPSTFEREMDDSIHHELAHIFIEWPVNSWKVSRTESFLSAWNEKFGRYNELNMDPNWKQKALSGKGRPNGFASYYGTTSEEEDRATVAQTLFNGDAAKLQRGDPVIREKIQYMKRFYFVSSGGLMDEEYWNARAAMKLKKPAPDQKWFQEKRKRIASMDYEEYKSSPNK